MTQRKFFAILLAASALAFVCASETPAPRMVLFQEFTTAVG